MTQEFMTKGAEAPKESNYLNPIKGEIKFRIVSPLIYGYEYWTDEKKPVRLREYPKEMPSDIRMEKDSKGVEKYTIKHFWAFKVLDREDGRVKITEITQNSIKRHIEDLISDKDWGSPFDYDIKIKGEGDGFDRVYTVTPSNKTPLTKEEQSIVARTEVNLEALYDGENPFEEIVKPESVNLDEEEVKVDNDLKSVPF